MDAQHIPSLLRRICDDTHTPNLSSMPPKHLSAQSSEVFPFADCHPMLWQGAESANLVWEGEYWRVCACRCVCAGVCIGVCVARCMCDCDNLRRNHLNQQQGSLSTLIG